MSEISARLALPYLMPAQAQKHVTHNEALRLLDLTVQLVLEATEAETPPALPSEGEIWALGPAPTGDWAGQAARLAGYVDSAWLFFDPKPGWRAWDSATAMLRVWDGSIWAAAGSGGAPGSLANLTGLGVNSGFDSINRLTVAAPATLLTHDGAGHQLKLNKATPGDTASLLFQTAWGGRAEMGTAGSDDFAIKVSADANTWVTALAFDAVSGHATGTAVAQDARDTTPGRLITTGSAGIAGHAVPLTGPAALTAQGLGGGLYDAPAALPDLPEASHDQTLFLGHSAANGGRYAALSLRQTDLPGDQRAWFGSGTPGDGAITWTELWHRANTTVDANGFLKEASPILRLFADHTEEPVEPVGARLTRQGTGHYVLNGAPPLARTGWQMETPMDGNGTRLVHVALDYDSAARRLIVQTTTPRWDADQGWHAGAATDIPQGRWIDLRFDRG